MNKRKQKKKQKKTMVIVCDSKKAREEIRKIVENTKMGKETECFV